MTTKVHLTPTQYEADHNGYHYSFKKYKNEWFAHRWPLDKPRIPPMCECLTIDGWKPVIKPDIESPTHRVESLDELVVVATTI